MIWWWCWWFEVVWKRKKADSTVSSEFDDDYPIGEDRHLWSRKASHSYISSPLFKNGWMDGWTEKKRGRVKKKRIVMKTAVILHTLIGLECISKGKNLWQPVWNHLYFPFHIVACIHLYIYICWMFNNIQTLYHYRRQTFPCGNKVQGIGNTKFYSI